VGELTKSDVLSLLTDIERGIENCEAGMGRGSDEREIELNDCIRKGKIRGYRYVKSRLLALAHWKDIDIE